MSRDELLAHLKRELHRMLGENNQRVIDLLEHAIAGDNADTALDVLTIVKAPFQREVKEGSPQSAEYEDAKFVLQQRLDPNRAGRVFSVQELKEGELEEGLSLYLVNNNPEAKSKHRHFAKEELEEESPFTWGKFAELWECPDCEHLYHGEVSLCDCHGPRAHQLKKYRATLVEIN